jgi:hypothetical protein
MAHLGAPLDRKADVSTDVLTKISDAPPKSLSAHQARGWVAELEDAIRQTKVRLACAYTLPL